MDLSTKQKQAHRHTEQACQCREGGRDRLGAWGWQVQTIVCRMDQQCPVVQYRGYAQYPVKTIMEKNI